MTTNHTLRLGTRGSALALAQAEAVRRMLEERTQGLRVELRIITTKGDQILDRPLAAIGDKGLFVKEIEAALLDESTDLAVHSCKDLPSQITPELALAAFPERADPRDALVSPAGDTLESLPERAVVGTSSLRRAAQLLALRPDIQIKTVRGNVDTRLRKLDSGEYDALLLAAAGLTRLGLEGRISTTIAPEQMIPAVAQGALALQCRAGDRRTHELLAALDHRPTHLAVTAERALLRRLEAGCQLPVGGYATLSADGSTITLRGMIGALDGSQVVRASESAHVDQAEQLGIALADQLRARADAAGINFSQRSLS